PHLYALPLHDALPISREGRVLPDRLRGVDPDREQLDRLGLLPIPSEPEPSRRLGSRDSRLQGRVRQTDTRRVERLERRLRAVDSDRKSTRLNSSHVKI